MPALPVIDEQGTRADSRYQPRHHQGLRRQGSPEEAEAETEAKTDEPAEEETAKGEEAEEEKAEEATEEEEKDEPKAETEKAEDEVAEKDDKVMAAIAALGDDVKKHLGEVKTELQAQKARIARLEKSETVSNSTQPESSEEDDKPVQDINWPMNMNDPRLNKDEVTKRDSVSFWDE